MKHTMGPWKVIEQDIYTHVAHNELGFRIANVFNQFSGGEFAKEEVKANAALIAAAPSLYRDLEIAANAIEMTSHLLEGDSCVKARMLVAVLRGTLERARGES